MPLPAFRKREGHRRLKRWLWKTPRWPAQCSAVFYGINKRSRERIMAKVDNLVRSIVKVMFPLLKVFLTALAIDPIHTGSIHQPLSMGQLFDFCAFFASFEKMLMSI